MTISTEVRKAGPFIGNGSASVFPFAFKVFKAADLIVVRRQDNIGTETTLVLDSDYHVTLNSNQDTTPGGVVTLVAGALASGFTLVVSSELPYLQPTDLTNQGGFYPKVITNALDRLTIFCQQLAEITGRTLKLPITAPTNISTEIPLPNPAELIAWDETGTKLTTVSPQSLVTSIAYGSATADLFAGDGVTTTFPLSTNPASVNNLDVSIDGRSQRPVQEGIGDYSWNGGATITFVEPPPAPTTPGDKNVLVRYMQAIPVSDSEALHAQTREALRRSYADAGYTLVDGSFETGGTLSSTTDVLLLESAGTAYAWTGVYPSGGYDVAPGIDPTVVAGFELRAGVGLRTNLASDGGALLLFHKSPIANAISQSLQSILDLQPITPEMFGADDTVVGDTTAMVNAFAFAYINPCKIELSRIYKLNQPLTCYYVQTHNKGFALIGKHKNCGISWLGTDVVNQSFVIDVHGYDPVISTIRMQEDSSAAKLNTGIRVCGEGVLVEDIISRGKWRYGVLGIACLKGSRFNNINGSLMPNGTAVTDLEGVPLQLSACVNASVSQLVANLCEYPVATGGTYDAVNTLKPPSFTQTITWGSEGVTINDSVGVFIKYGPRLAGIEIQCSGSVWDLIYDKFCFIDGTSIKVQRNWFGANSATPTMVNAFPKWDTSGAHVTFTNNTVSMGAATALTTPTTASSTFSHAYVDFSGNHVENFQCNVTSSNRCSVTNNVSFGDGTPDVVQLTPDANSVFIAQQRKSRFCQGVILGQSTPDGDGKLQVRADSGQRFFNMYTAVGNILSTCPGGLGVNTVTPASDAVLYVGSMTSSNRSINARGTINASGADYAEYIKKSVCCGSIEKGQIVGINGDAEITDRFDDAVAFAIKSTDPAIVGGDTWGKDIEYPEWPDVSEPRIPIFQPKRHGQSDTEYNSSIEELNRKYESELSAYMDTMREYEKNISAYNEKIEEIRVQYDRVAFSGQVPCNVIGSTPGDYVVPVRGEDGAISCKLTASPTFDEYMKAVGQVWKLLGDGRAWVSVKIA